MIVVNIQRMSTDDGPGIRTTVFLKGCPLRCLWCHNPECMETERSGGFNQNWPDSFDFDGDWEGFTAGLIRDKAFFAATGGGVTFSGGEPLLHPDFVREAAGRLRKLGVGTAVDTCGLVPFEAFRAVLPVTDLFLYDLKAADTSRHRELTGQGNERIWENLYRLLECGKEIRIRIPVVGGANQSELVPVINRIPVHPGIQCVELLSYHTYGIRKYEQLGLEYRQQAFRVPEPGSFAEAVRLLEQKGLSYQIH